MSDRKFSAFTLSYVDVHDSQPISLQDSQMLYYKIVYYTLTNNNTHLHTVLKNMNLDLLLNKNLYSSSKCIAILSKCNVVAV